MVEKKEKPPLPLNPSGGFFSCLLAAFGEPCKFVRQVLVSQVRFRVLAPVDMLRIPAALSCGSRGPACISGEGLHEALEAPEPVLERPRLAL